MTTLEGLLVAGVVVTGGLGVVVVLRAVAVVLRVTGVVVVVVGS